MNKRLSVKPRSRTLKAMRRARDMEISEPTVAAPDVAAMVKRLRDISEGRESRIAHIFKDCRQAAALIEKLGQGGWIPVSKRLPERGIVLAVTADGQIDMYQWNLVADYANGPDPSARLTHWQALPPPPERP